MRLALPLILLVQTAQAQTPMTPEEFERWSTGRTLDYSTNGQLWGSEAYLPGRRVIDADAGGPCRDGSWHAEGDAVCFVYPGFEGTHCWLYWREGDAVYAKNLLAAPEDPPQLVTPAAAPLSCTPEVGV